MSAGLTVELTCLRLFITGKVAVARAIAQALSSKLPISKQKPLEKSEAYFQVGHDCVTWTGGHLLELAGPESYDEAYRQWRLDQLPIIPRQTRQQQWLYLVQHSRTAQMGVIRDLLEQAETVVHAGDPDREGQWMVDEVLAYVHNRRPVLRMLVQDLNSKALHKVLLALEQTPQCNDDFKSLAISARARSQADWLYGLNMTRAYTLLGRHSGYEHVLSVGRVQTALLALVVQRDEAIEHFNPKNYFELRVKFRHEADMAFLKARIAEAEFCYADWQGKQHTSDVAHADVDFYQAIDKKIRGKLGEVIQREEQHHAAMPPLPLNLSTLQIECAVHFGYSAAEVIELCQHLYEEFHLITYPRSDCRYLPEQAVDEANAVLEAVQKNLAGSEFLSKEALGRADTWHRSACWDNKKIKSHHAIIPTDRWVDSKLLSESQRHVYQMISRYYAAQFFGDKLSTETKLVFNVAGEEFVVSRTEVTDAGWQQVIPELHESSGADILRHALPSWQPGDKINCEDVDILSKKTRPPLRFTDASLMAAMTSIAPFVSNDELKHSLHDMDGLGTESTRAHIIERLFNRGYLMKGSRNIFSTPIGRDLIHALPLQATQVDMTARWEKTLQQMADMDAVAADSLAEQFIADVEKQVALLMEQARQKKNMALTSADKILGIATEIDFHCPKCQSLLVLRGGKNGDFWGCSAYPQCRYTAPDRIDNTGKHIPDFAVDEGVKNAGAKTITNLLDKNCPECGKALVKRKGKHGMFAGCSGYPTCTHTETL